MIVPISVLAELLQALPQLRAQIYFKSSMTALSHAMEDLVLAGSDEPLVIATFQRERFYRQEAHRYRRIASRSSQVYVLAAPETEFKNSSECHETVAFAPEDALSQEWNLVVLGENYSTCLICQEKFISIENQDSGEPLLMDQARRFEGIWTFDREVSCKAAALLLDRILQYRPELAEKIDRARTTYNLAKTPKKQRKSAKAKSTKPDQTLEKTPKIPNPKLSDAFAERLVTYLQAGQHKLLKAYSAIAAQERKERLVNLITTAMRQSLNPQEIVEVAVQELGTALSASRCLIYRCKATDIGTKIDREFLRPGTNSVFNQTWPLQENPIFRDAVTNQERVYIEDAAQHPLIVNTEFLRSQVKQWQIISWLMVPVLYQGRVLGMMELHQCRSTLPWEEDELALVEAIATQLGAALIQSETYEHLE